MAYQIEANLNSNLKLKIKRHLPTPKSNKKWRSTRIGTPICSQVVWQWRYTNLQNFRLETIESSLIIQSYFVVKKEVSKGEEEAKKNAIINSNKSIANARQCL